MTVRWVVEGGAPMILASTTVPDLSSNRLLSSEFLTSPKIHAVSLCRAEEVANRAPAASTPSRRASLPSRDPPG